MGCEEPSCNLGFCNSDDTDDESTLKGIELQTVDLAELHDYLNNGLQIWRRHFDKLYLKLSELGCEDDKQGEATFCTGLADPCKVFIYNLGGRTKKLDPRVLDQECNSDLLEFWKNKKDMTTEQFDSWLE